MSPVNVKAEELGETIFTDSAVSFGGRLQRFQYQAESIRDSTSPPTSAQMSPVGNGPKSLEAAIKTEDETADEPLIGTYSGVVNESIKSEYENDWESSIRSAQNPEGVELGNEDWQQALGPPSRTKSAKTSAKYAPPSVYAHLPKLPDTLAHNLICIFVGLNPGLTTAASGHPYAHPANLFWKLLYSSGCSPVLCKPEENGTLPKRFLLGNTNLVDRPTRNQSELKFTELVDSVQALEDKIAEYKPSAVCVVGKGIWEAIFKKKHDRKLKKDEFEYGWQDQERMGITRDWEGARVFVSTSTSGLAASTLPAEKQRIWSILGTWVREERVTRLGQLS